MLIFKKDFFLLVNQRRSTLGQKQKIRVAKLKWQVIYIFSEVISRDIFPDSGPLLSPRCISSVTSLGVVGRRWATMQSGNSTGLFVSLSRISLFIMLIAKSCFRNKFDVIILVCFWTSRDLWLQHCTNVMEQNVTGEHFAHQFRDRQLFILDVKQAREDFALERRGFQKKENIGNRRDDDDSIN